MKVEAGCYTADGGRRRIVRESSNRSGSFFLSIQPQSSASNRPAVYSLQPTVSGFRTAFTLIELLVVIVLIGIVSAIAVPSFVRSIRGQRISTAARTLATVARYARSMAVIKQTDLALTFNLANGQIDVVSSNASLPAFSRLVEGVRVQEVTIGDGEAVTEGTCVVPFLRSGICIPFAVTIMDPDGEYVIMKIDALGSVKSKVFGTQ